MTLQAITAQRIFDGKQFHYDTALLVQNGIIAGLIHCAELAQQIPVMDFADRTLVPGFIDIQVNGGGGVMFNSDTSAEGIDRICRAHRQHGTAHLLPTLISDTPQQLANALHATRHAMDSGISGVLGIHLEGPWLNPDKKGAHNDGLFYDPGVDELTDMPWLTHGTTLITLAPEKVNADAIRWLAEKGIILSCGHSNATHAELSAGTLSHISGFTHLFNAMSPLEGREPGVVGTALMTDHAWCSIITDGIHVDAHNVLLANRTKPDSKLLIVTDAMATVGSDSDSFTLNDEVISVIDNKLVNASGSLAGAHIGMDQSVAKVIGWGIEESEAFRMASTYPAEALKQDKLGYLSEGYRASFTVLDHDYRSHAVMVDGELYHCDASSE